MNDHSNLISTLAFRRLLFGISDKQADVCIRFRLLGDMWKPNFMRIVRITERGAIFNDDSISEFVYVSDLIEVVQFELDGRFQEFQPHFHYEVKPGSSAS